MSDELSECDEKIKLENLMTEQVLVKFEGTLYKWTNFIHGWQERFFVLKDGFLYYYRSQNEKDLGFRGSISIQRATIKLSPTDEFRFDISVGDCVWYLRCLYKELRDEWVQALELHINPIDSAYGSDNSLKKTGSVVSLEKNYSLKDKIAEIETFRNILTRKLDVLQIYFDKQVQLNRSYDVLNFNAASDANKSINNENNDSTNLMQKENSTSDYLSQKSSSKANIATNFTNHTSNQNNNVKHHQRHHSYSNPQLLHSNTQNKHHKRSFSHNSKNLEVLKQGSPISICLESRESLISKTNHNSLSSLDFKGEAINFKTTADSLLDSLKNCLDMMQQKEEMYLKKLELESEKRKKVEDLLKQVTSSANGLITDPIEINKTKTSKNVLDCGPDYFEEGPNSKIKEEEFFDALDAMLDKSDQQEEEKRQLKIRMKDISAPSALPIETCDHALWPEIDKITLDQLYYARLEVGNSTGCEDTNGWHIFAEEGEMRLYKRELEIDGLVCDPLKAVHVVKGITAHEVCHHFFSPNVRWDWENTLESMKVLEEINGNTLILHQIHKKVWLAAQRDTVFWSHIRKVPINELKDLEENTKKPDDVWIVCNNSTSYVDVPLGRCLRMKITVSMTCETYIDKPIGAKEITRDHIKCKIIYCSQINPGGWAPASVLRALYKREYPKFLKRFTQYVIDAQESEQIMF